jgi:hypothetical protein
MANVVMRPRAVRRGPRAPLSGTAYEWHHDNVLKSGAEENLWGQVTAPAGTAFRFFLDGPNFIINQSLRMDKIREENKIDGGRVELIGDGHAWYIDRVVLAAGSLYIRNMWGKSPHFRTQGVRFHFRYCSCHSANRHCVFMFFVYSML